MLTNQIYNSWLDFVVDFYRFETSITVEWETESVDEREFEVYIRMINFLRKTGALFGKLYV